MGKENLHIRLNQTYDYLLNKGIIHNQTQFADAIGMRVGHLNNALHGDERRLTQGLMTKIAEAYSEYFNKDWLLTGKGQMEKIDTRKMRPDIPAVVAAGFTDVAITSVMESDVTAEPLIPFISDYDFTIDVTGDSMEPEIHDGDKIACRWISSEDTFRANKIYLLDTEDGAVVKCVKRVGSTLHCTSLNPKYGPFPIEVSTVIRAAVVIATLHHL